MSDITREFTVEGHPEIAVAVFSTDVDVVEGSDGSIKVEINGAERELERFEIVQTGDTVTVRSRKGGRSWIGRGTSVRLTVPVSTSAAVKTASGDVRFSVPISDVEIDVSSGDVHLASLSDRGRIRAASGDVTIGDIAGGIRISTASGDVRIDELNGDASINTASGDVKLGTVHGSVDVRTASGDVTIRRFSGVILEGGAVSGGFDIGLMPGMSIEADIQTRSGRFRNLSASSSGRDEPSISATMRLKTMSGNVTLR